MNDKTIQNLPAKPHGHAIAPAGLSTQNGAVRKPNAAVKRLWISLALTTACIASPGASTAQQSPLERFREHNAQMTSVQPSWMGPLIQSDPRLAQAVKLSVSNSQSPSAQVISYGNNHGVSVVAFRRFQFDFIPPSFFRNHSPVLKDGFGNAATQVKYRIASGNEEHGNFALTAIVTHGFAPRAYQNGVLSSYYSPRLAAGMAFGRFNVQSTLGGFLPTDKVSAQGRAIEWNTTAQVHPARNVWIDVEDNVAFNIGGAFDGTTQNFVTPAAFYLARRGDWGPRHPAYIFGTGMQIATTTFHQYNHNLITEMRILF
jgi:hypothetical protein